MKYLLDTVTFLWMLFDETDRLSESAREALDNDRAELFFSAASAWEIAIKHSIGKLPLKKPPAAWLPEIVGKMDLHPLPIHARHALAVANLHWHHRDPFDRLLVCQAHSEGLTIITPDTIFRRYHVPIIW